MITEEGRLRAEDRHPVELTEEAVGRDDEEDVVVGRVEEKRRRQQVVLPHVVVLVEEDGGEEALVRADERRVVLVDPRGNVLSLRFRADDGHGRVDAE